jgi:predicted Holliday junction resolvase-like endonuclease
MRRNERWKRNLGPWPMPKQEHTREIRANAVQQSLAITKGKVTEHLVPFLLRFDLDPKDVRFQGTPIDLIAFSGFGGCRDRVHRDQNGAISLSPRERAVKKAVEAKRVSWRVINPDLEVGRPLARV